MADEKMETIEIDLEDETFLAIAMEAHKKNITFNQMVSEILTEQLDIEDKKEKKNG
jgi:hypothetical protein